MASNLPQAYKPIAHYLKIAYEHANRDPAVYYWSIYYALQNAMLIDKKSTDCVKFLTEALADLEKLKKQNRENEAVTNEIVAQAHIEQYALKLFAYADNEDRNSRFNKNVVKAFYTAGHLFDVLTLFGELDNKLVEARKYAKWKAAYIHNCLKNGETPHAGPLEEDNAGFADQQGFDLNVPTPSNSQQFNSSKPENSNQISSGSLPGFFVPPDNPPINESSTSNYDSSKMDVYLKAQKFCKLATSALDYEDEKTAIDNLTKALNLLTKGGST